MRPFDLQKALAGAKVQTRDGRGVTQLTYFPDAKQKYCIACVVDNYLRLYDKEGCFYIGGTDDKDLVMTPIKKKGWLNIYPVDGKNPAHLGNPGAYIFSTKEQADAARAAACIVACVEVEWEEEV